MSATSKRDRALLAGEEPVTGKAIHEGSEPMPEHLDMAAKSPDPEPEPDTEPPVVEEEPPTE